MTHRSRVSTARTPRGTWEIYAWDRETGDQRARSPTGRTAPWMAGLDPNGRVDLVVRRHRRRRVRRVAARSPSSGGADGRATPAGARRTRPGWRWAAAARPWSAAPTRTARPSTGRPGAEPARALRARARTPTGSASPADESLIAIEHSEHGDSRAPGAARRCARTARPSRRRCGTAPGKGLSAASASPRCAGDPRLLVDARAPRPLGAAGLGPGHRRRSARSGLSTCRARSAPSWYPDGAALLRRRTATRRASELYRYDLATGELAQSTPRRGTVSGARPRARTARWSTAGPRAAEPAGDPLDRRARSCWPRPGRAAPRSRAGGGRLGRGPRRPDPRAGLQARGRRGAVPDRLRASTAGRPRTTATPSRRARRPGSTTASRSSGSTTAARPATAGLAGRARASGSA